MWINFGIKDFIDILLVAIFLYQTYKLMKKSGTLAIFSGVVSFIIAWILVSQVLEMRLMGAIFDKFILQLFVMSCSRVCIRYQITSFYKRRNSL